MSQKGEQALWRRQHPKEVSERHKRNKQIASLSGQAGALRQAAGKAHAAARLPYTIERTRFGFVKSVTCDVCGRDLPHALLGFGVVPHTKSTCAGPAAKMMAPKV